MNAELLASIRAGTALKPVRVSDGSTGSLGNEPADAAATSPAKGPSGLGAGFAAQLNALFARGGMGAKAAAAESSSSSDDDWSPPASPAPTPVAAPPPLRSPRSPLEMKPLARTFTPTQRALGSTPPARTSRASLSSEPATYPIPVPPPPPIRATPPAPPPPQQQKAAARRRSLDFGAPQAADGAAPPAVEATRVKRRLQTSALSDASPCTGGRGAMPPVRRPNRGRRAPHLRVCAPSPSFRPPWLQTGPGLRAWARLLVLGAPRATCSRAAKEGDRSLATHASTATAIATAAARYCHHHCHRCRRSQPATPTRESSRWSLPSPLSSPPREPPQLSHLPSPPLEEPPSWSPSASTAAAEAAAAEAAAAAAAAGAPRARPPSLRAAIIAWRVVASPE